MKSSISDRLLRLIQISGEAGYPHESAGALIGRCEPAGNFILEMIALENRFETSEQRRRYRLDPLEFFDVEEQAESRGLVVVGIFHSHPDHPAQPSEYDLAWSLPNYTYLITSIIQGIAVETRAWRLSPDRSRFEEETIEITQPVQEGK